MARYLFIYCLCSLKNHIYNFHDDNNSETSCFIILKLAMKIQAIIVNYQAKHGVKPKS